MPVIEFKDTVNWASSKQPVLFAPEKTLTLKRCPSEIVAVVVNDELADGCDEAGTPL